MIVLHCHILPGVDDGPCEFRESLQMALMAAQEGHPPKVYPGMEVALNPETPGNLKRGQELGLNRTRYLLRKLPQLIDPNHILEAVFQLFVIERLLPQPGSCRAKRDPAEASRTCAGNIVCNGVMVQINGGSLHEDASRKIIACAEKLLRQQAQVVATDA
jgi:protein-tyrosine phosphatase